MNYILEIIIDFLIIVIGLLVIFLLLKICYQLKFKKFNNLPSNIDYIKYLKHKSKHRFSPEDGYFFEAMTSVTFDLMGFTIIENTGSYEVDNKHIGNKNDHCIDLLLEINNTLIAVQCKCLSNKYRIKTKDILAFNGVRSLLENCLGQKVALMYISNSSPYANNDELKYYDIDCYIFEDKYYYLNTTEFNSYLNDTGKIPIKHEINKDNICSVNDCNLNDCIGLRFSYKDNIKKIEFFNNTLKEIKEKSNNFLGDNLSDTDDNLSILSDIYCLGALNNDFYLDGVITNIDKNVITIDVTIPECKKSDIDYSKVLKILKPKL